MFKTLIQMRIQIFFYLPVNYGSVLPKKNIYSNFAENNETVGIFLVGRLFHLSELTVKFCRIYFVMYYENNLKQYVKNKTTFPFANKAYVDIASNRFSESCRKFPQ